MPVTKVGAVYATRSKLLQRIYIPDDDTEIARQHVHTGETQIFIDIEVYRAGGPAAVQAIIGTPAHDGTCRVLHKETSEIIDRIVADPDIYKHPDGHRVVLVK